MKWRNCKLLILSCYFVGFSCFCSAVFLPQAVNLSKVNSVYMAESVVIKENAKPVIAQEKKKPKNTKSTTATAYNQ